MWTCFHLYLFLTENLLASKIFLNSLHPKTQVSSFSSLNPVPSPVFLISSLGTARTTNPPTFILVVLLPLTYKYTPLRLSISFFISLHFSLSIQSSIELSSWWFTSSLPFPYSKEYSQDFALTTYLKIFSPSHSTNW